MGKVKLHIFTINVHPGYLPLRVSGEGVSARFGKMLIGATAHINEILVL